MGSPPPPYRFFHSTFVPPDDDPSAIASSQPAALWHGDVDAGPADSELLHVFPTPVQTPAAIRSIIEVDVRISPTTQRTWFIEKCIISRHSADLRAACEVASAASICLDGDTFSLPAFQNFIDFSHSNIYSANKRASDYHVVHTHVQAWLLGAKLEAPCYQIAALRELYSRIEPLGHAVNSSAAHSPIRAEDVDFLCRKTPEGCVLRAIIFDAVAAHWTQHDAITIGTNLARKFMRETAPEPDSQPAELDEALSWTSLYNKYRCFRKRMSSSLKVRDTQRTRLLRPVNDYIAGKTGMQENEFMNEGTVSSFFGMGPRPLRAQKHMRSPSRRRRSSSASSEGSQRARSTEKQVGEDQFMTMEDT